MNIDTVDKLDNVELKMNCSDGILIDFFDSVDLFNSNRWGLNVYMKEHAFKLNKSGDSIIIESPESVYTFVLLYKISEFIPASFSTIGHIRLIYYMFMIRLNKENKTQQKIFSKLDRRTYEDYH